VFHLGIVAEALANLDRALGVGVAHGVGGSVDAIGPDVSQGRALEPRQAPVSAVSGNAETTRFASLAIVPIDQRPRSVLAREVLTTKARRSVAGLLDGAYPLGIGKLRQELEQCLELGRNPSPTSDLREPVHRLRRYHRADGVNGKSIADRKLLHHESV